MIARQASALVLCALVAVSAAAQQPQLPPRDLPRSQSASVGSGSIAGVVRAADTGMPLRGVDIRLTGADLRASARGAFTDARGVFEFAGLPDGEYTLVASKVRYMTMTHGQTRAGEAGRPVQVTGGRRVENVDFALPAGAVIVLRVGDRFGDPAIGYPVSLYQAKPGAGERALAQVPVSGFPPSTDDRGEVRLSGLPPGEYYVSAGGGPTLPGTAAAPEQEVRTYYPGTPADSDAQPITVGLGEEVAVSFNTVVSRTYRISGTVVGNAPADQVRVDRVTPAGATILDMSIGSGRTFSRASLSPGEYVLTARNEKEIGSVHVLVGGADISDLVLTMRPATPIRGRVTFEGAPPRGLAPTAFVLRPALVNSGIAAIAQYQKGDWTFEIPALTGSGVIRGDLPRGWFMKAVLLDGRDVTDTVLDFESYQGKPLEVVVTQTATEISGRVADASGRAVPNYVAVAFPADSRRWTPLTSMIASARPDQEGRFTVRGLPPGSYLVAAVDYLPAGQERDPKTLERLRAGAAAVTLTDAQVATVELRLTP
jgi:hypothetical protein